MNAERSFYAGLLGWEYGESHPTRVAGSWRRRRASPPPVWRRGPRRCPCPAGPSTSAAPTSTRPSHGRRSWGRRSTCRPCPSTSAASTCSIAVLADPGGAVFGLSEPGEHKGIRAHLRPGLGRLVRVAQPRPGCRHGLLPRTARGQGHQGRCPDGLPPRGVAEGADFAGLMAMPDEVPAEAPSYWSIYFEVDDAAAAVDFASESGATVIFGPQTMPDIGTIANVLDPEHAAVSVLEPPRGE